MKPVVAGFSLRWFPDARTLKGAATAFGLTSTHHFP